jgi:hypothetical protein
MANQYNSPKGAILKRLDAARAWIRTAEGYCPVKFPYSARPLMFKAAALNLREARAMMAAAPASTRRRWKAGR